MEYVKNINEHVRNF